MDLQSIFNLFEQWFRGERLSEDEAVLIALCIIACVLLFATIVILILAAHVFRFWMYVGWFFEDVWEWLKYVCRRIFRIKGV